MHKSSGFLQYHQEFAKVRQGANKKEHLKNQLRVKLPNKTANSEKDVFCAKNQEANYNSRFVDLK